MKALVVYASWLGHNRAIAQAVADELRRGGLTVACAPVSKMTPEDVIGFDLLVFGTYTHATRASKRLRDLCDAIPLKRLLHATVGVFGTQQERGYELGESCGADELAACLEARGVSLAVEPLHVTLRGPQAFLPMSTFSPNDLRAIAAFAAELCEAVSPVSVAA